MSPSSPTHLHERVSFARRGRGLTQQELATRSGLPQSAISKIERGQVLDPALSTVQALAKALMLSLPALADPDPQVFWDEMFAEPDEQGDAETKEETSSVVLEAMGLEEDDTENDLDFIVPDHTRKIVEDMLLRAIRYKASDIHIRPNGYSSVISFRSDGELQTMTNLNKDIADKVVQYLKLQANLNTEQISKPQDGRFKFSCEGRDIKVRISTMPTAYKRDMAVLRIFDPSQSTPSLEEIGLTADNLIAFRKALAHPWGIVVCCGSVGSGSTTTMQAAVKDMITTNPQANVIGIEGSVETNLPGVTSVELPRLGDSESLFSYGDALRSVLQTDPDIIFVGETRDPDTARAVIHAAQTGHFLLTTMSFSGSAPYALERFRELSGDLPSSFEALEAITCQQRIRRLCENCKQLDPMEEGALIYKAREGGCVICRKTGYYGTIALVEVLVINDKVRQALQEKKPTHVVALADEGYRPMSDIALTYLLAGETSREEVERFSRLDK